jgi:hypothetical protein
LLLLRGRKFLLFGRSWASRKLLAFGFAKCLSAKPLLLFNCQIRWPGLLL